MMGMVSDGVRERSNGWKGIEGKDDEGEDEDDDRKGEGQEREMRIVKIKEINVMRSKSVRMCHPILPDKF